MKEKKLLQNPWVVSIFSSVIATLLASLILSVFSKNTFLKSIGIVIEKIVNIFIAIILFRIPIWVLLGLVILLIVILVIIDKVSITKNIDWLSYKSEYYKNWNLVWDYEKDYEGKYEISNLRPICTCGCEMSERINRYNGEKELYCPRCNQVYKMFYREDYEDAKKIIYYKIKNWKSTNGVA